MVEAGYTAWQTQSCKGSITMPIPLSATDKWLSTFTTPQPATRLADGPNGEWEYYVHLKAVMHSFHPSMDAVKVWTYGNGTSADTWPGVTIEAQSDQPVRVTFVNDLVGENCEALMTMVTRQGMEEGHMINQASHNQVHLHGARVPWTSDGGPMNVFHPNETRGYYYPNKQAAATLWYHDHAMDIARLNVYAGLAGIYVLRGPAEAGKLPEGEFELPMVLQDRSFTTAGEPLRLLYEQNIDLTSDQAIKIDKAPVVTPEFLGSYPVVNGKIWPKMLAKGAVYRWRLVNGANTRYFNLTLSPKDNAAEQIKFHIIGTDGGLLPKPVEIDHLVLAPGERADLLIDLTKHTGKELVLRNSADIPYPGNNAANADFPCDELLLLQVDSTVVSGHDKFKPTDAAFRFPPRTDPIAGGDMANIPALTAIDAKINAHLLANEGVNGQLVPVEYPDLLIAGATPFSFTYRRFLLEEYQLRMPTLKGVAAPSNTFGLLNFTNLRVPTVLINGKDGKKAKPVVTTMENYEVWEFVNLTPDSHPMHVHLVQSRVLSRYSITKLDDSLSRPKTARLPEPFRADGYGSAAAVEPYEAIGWKDTVRCEPDQVTRLLMRFDGYSGEYVYHCHILEHEDMGMMFDLKVEPKP